MRRPRSRGGSAGRTLIVRGEPSRTTVSGTGWPLGTVAAYDENASRESIGLPATVVITSPARNPASAAADPLKVLETRAPRVARRPSRFAAFRVTAAVTARTPA